MHSVLLTFVTFFFCSFKISAGILFPTYKERYEKSDLVANAKVISIVQVIETLKLQENGDIGATQMAVLEIQKIWKNPKSDIIPLNENNEFEPVDAKVPRYVMIPCGYNFDKSFRLDDGSRYILFLKQIENTLYVPFDIDAALRLKGKNVYLQTPLSPEYKNKLVISTLDFINYLKK